MTWQRFSAASSLALLIALFAAPAAWGQRAPALQIDLDQAVFAFDENQSLVELYLAFEAATLTFDAAEAGFRAQLQVDATIQRASSATLQGSPTEAVWADSLNLSFVIADTSGLAPGQQFVHQIRTTVPPGEYEVLIFIGGDPVTGRTDVTIRREIVVSDFADSQDVELSDVTLASEIRRAENRDEPFYKNGLVVRPNANQLFGTGLSHIFFYAEAYNLDHLAPLENEYTVFSYIAEANLPQPLPDLQRRTPRPLRSPDVVVGSFDLAKLPSGSYFLRIALLNSKNEALVERSRKFYVFNPGVEREAIAGLDEDFENSRYANMPVEEVETAIDHIQIVATEAERRRVRSIADLDERRRFLMEFWLKRDPNPTTPVNEFQEQFYQRLQYANDRYKSSFQEGWETDRGRALIKYGSPVDVEMHLYDRDTVPYEIWSYNNIPGEGQAIFIFADRDGYGLFELLHSSVSGERKMGNWQAELRR